MMRSVGLFLILVSISSGGSPQGSHSSFALNFKTGLQFELKGDDSQAWPMIGLLGMEFSDPSLPVDLFGDVCVSWHHVEHNVILYASSYDDLLIPVTGGIRYSLIPHMPLNPYVAGGLSLNFYHFDYSESTIVSEVPSRSRTHIGLGLSARAGLIIREKLFVEGAYDRILHSWGWDRISVSFGIRL